MAGRPKADSGIKSKKDIVSTMHSSKVFDVETLVVDGARNNDAFEKLQKLFPVHDSAKRKISDAEIKIAYTHETGKPFPVRETKKRSSGRNPAPPAMSVEQSIKITKEVSADVWDEYNNLKAQLAAFETQFDEHGGIGKVQAAFGMRDAFAAAYVGEISKLQEELAALKAKKKS